MSGAMLRELLRWRRPAAAHRPPARCAAWARALAARRERRPMPYTPSAMTLLTPPRASRWVLVAVELRPQIHLAVASGGGGGAPAGPRQAPERTAAGAPARP